MGKRQLRIFRTDLANHQATLPGREANILLTDQTTLHGYILKLDEDWLFMRDMRRREHKIKVAEVEEIMLDRETTF